MNTLTKLIQLIGGATFIVTEIMQMYRHSHLTEQPDPVHHVDGTTIVGRPGYIQTNDM